MNLYLQQLNHHVHLKKQKDKKEKKIIINQLDGLEMTIMFYKY